MINAIGTAGFLQLNVVNGFGQGTFSSQAGQVVPNLVANLRLDQPWGTAQISGAANRVAATYYSTNTTGPGGGTALLLGGGAGGLQNLGHPDDKWGFAGTAGTVLNLPWAKGDTLGFQAVYGKGASSYAANGQGTFNIVHGNGIGLGFVTAPLATVIACCVAHAASPGAKKARTTMIFPYRIEPRPRF